MATEAEPGATFNQKFLLLEQRIAQLELQLKKAGSKEDSSRVGNGTEAPPEVAALGSSGKEDENGVSSAMDAPAVGGKGLLEVDTTGTSKANGVRSSDAEGTQMYPLPAPDGIVDIVKSRKTPRIRHVIRQWDEDEKEWKDVRAPEKKESGKKDDADSGVVRAFTYRKTIDSDGMTVNSVEIDVEDPKLYDALKRAICKIYSNTYYDSWPANVYTIESPFQDVVHCHDELEQQALVHDDDDDETRAHKEDIQLLLEAVKISPDLAPYFKSRAETPNTIAFRYLWTLFPPGAEVVSRLFFNQWQLFRVNRATEPLSREDLADKPSNWPFDAWCYDWDGRHNGQYLRVFHQFRIENFDGQKEISQLNCYPLKYFKDTSTSQEKDTPESLREKLLKMGEQFKMFCNLSGAQRMFEYDDLAIAIGRTRTNALLKDDDTRPQSRSTYDDQYHITANEGAKRVKESAQHRRVKGRAIVDAEAYLERGNGSLHLGESRPGEVWEPDEELRDDRAPVNPDGEWARLCPPRILGFSLDQKQMLQFKVSKATTISKRKSKKSFEKELQLKQQHKDMLLALVDQHESRENTTNTVEDIIEGKGRSLVILLHGPPGVGKTLTAETVAKATGKPLIVVSVAEIGLKADQAEAKLERLFAYAARWEAILLVDEADVFLEARSSDAGTERNALVSVLLRVLEYYTGTIILTTNRISSLDIAVQSRIHLSIRYDDLLPADCEAIFALFITEAEFEDQEKDKVVEWFRDDVSEEKLNGRQIRNLVTSAQAIAKSEKKALNLKSFKSVFKVTQDFQKQLTEQTMRARALNEVRSGRGGK